MEGEKEKGAEEDAEQQRTAALLGRGISSEIYAMKLEGEDVAVKLFNFATQDRPLRTLSFVYNEIESLR